jgi:hypothetical protein
VERDGNEFMVTGAALVTINRPPVLLVPGDVFASRGSDPVLQQLEVPWSGDVSRCEFVLGYDQLVGRAGRGGLQRRQRPASQGGLRGGARPVVA